MNKKLARISRHVALLDEKLCNQENNPLRQSWGMFVIDMLARARRLEAELLLMDDDEKPTD